MQPNNKAEVFHRPGMYFIRKDTSRSVTDTNAELGQGDETWTPETLFPVKRMFATR